MKQKQINSSINKTEENPKMPTKRNFPVIKPISKRKIRMLMKSHRKKKKEVVLSKFKEMQWYIFS